MLNQYLYNFFCFQYSINVYNQPNSVIIIFLLKVFIFLFFLGLVGTLLSTNLLKFLLCLELMLLSVSVLFIFFSLTTATILGFIYVLVILTLAAAESAIGLGLVIIAFRLNKTINFSNYVRLRN